MVARAFLAAPSSQQADDAEVDENAVADEPAAPTQQDQARQAAKEFQTARPAEPQPLPSQAQLQAEDDENERKLEERLRAEDEASERNPQTLAPTPPDVGGSIPGNNPGAILSPEDAANHAANTASAAHEDIATNSENERALAERRGQTQSRIAGDSQEHIDHLASEIQLRHDHLAKVQADVEQQQQQAINNYSQVNTEMMNMAVAQPKDIYGAAGVNSILGRVAVFLGGAGSNGFGANNNLEYIERMATHNVAMQRQRYEFLSKVGEGQRTLYGMLNTKLSNAYQVDATLKNMGLEVYKANIMAVANKYSDQTTRQAAQDEVNKVNEAQAKNNLAVEQQVQANAQQNLANYSRMQANEVKAYAAQVKAKSSSSNLMPLKGFVGGVAASEHGRLSKMVGGARLLVDGLNVMERMMKEGRSAADVRRYFVNNALLFKGARDFLETGTRIEAGEQTIIDALKVNNSEAIFNLLFGEDPAALKAKLEEARRAVTAATYQNVKSAAPKTVALDSKDPLFGPYNPRTYAADPQEYFAGNRRSFNATHKGRAILENAPAYNEGAAAAQYGP
jgi:hypothetical protein